MIDVCSPNPLPTAPLASESGVGMVPTGWAAAARRHVIICVHADETLSTLWMPATSSAGWSSWQLADQAGYGIVAPDCGGATTWGNPTAVARIADAVTLALAALPTGLGSTSTKVGILGYSMGGIAALNYLLANPSKVAGMWLWEPALDIRFFNQTSVAYPGGVPYSASYAASAYNGSTAGTVTPTSTQATEILTAYGSTGFTTSDPMQNIASFRGLGVPVKITNASDDNGVPPAQMTYFVSQVADANITLRSPQPLGAHNTPGPMGGTPATSYPSTVPPGEVQQFFDQLAW